MLILVAVTVNVVVNSGLFGHAQDATRGYSEKQAQEQAIGNGTFNMVVNGVTYNSIEEYIEENPGTTVPGGDTGETTDPELDRSNIQVGDYIEYTPDTVSTPYSLTSAVSGHDTNQSIPQDTLQWRVMNINADGSVDLISATPTSTEVTFREALGYNNGVLVLNDICADLYSNATLGVTARSIDLVDIESKMNATGIAARDAYTYYGKQYGQTQTYADSYSYAPDIFGKTGTTAEEESKDYYESPTTATYEKKGSIEVTQTYYDFSSTPSTYFDDTTFHELIFGTGSNFWLASRYCFCRSANASFGLRYVNNATLIGHYLFISDHVERDGNYRVRPVVSLGNNIRISATGGTEENPRTISL